jgi:subtilisin family serine protease
LTICFTVCPTTNGGSEFRSFRALGFHVLNLPESAIQAISDRPDVAYVSRDRETQVLGHLSATTGADLARVTSGTNVSGVDGTGIGIAILDSGIDANHVSFLDRNNGNRIALSLDFTGEDRVDDPTDTGVS